MRPFTSTEEMDETMVDNWNRVVRPQDKVYHLGDIAMSKRPLHAIMPRLNGEKVLIKGNHDIEKLIPTSSTLRMLEAVTCLIG